MKIIPKVLLGYLQENKITAERFADELEVKMSEVEKLLNGDSVEYKTAVLFIYYFGADKAQHIIDWNGMGIKNPLAKEV